MCGCVRTHVRACVRACLCVCVRVCVYLSYIFKLLVLRFISSVTLVFMYVCMHVCKCVRMYIVFQSVLFRLTK